ncbi:MAG: hypothetical protein GY775_01225 [Candidatus Scalindua sp.]|nr:hypothetical protein [Candidatus Scalindua sp.]
MILQLSFCHILKIIMLIDPKLPDLFMLYREKNIKVHHCNEPLKGRHRTEGIKRRHHTKGVNIIFQHTIYTSDTYPQVFPQERL